MATKTYQTPLGPITVGATHKVNKVLVQSRRARYSNPPPVVNVSKPTLEWLYTQQDLDPRIVKGKHFAKGYADKHGYPTEAIPQWLWDAFRTSTGRAAGREFGWGSTGNATLFARIAHARPESRRAVVELGRIHLAKKDIAYLQAQRGLMADEVERMQAEINEVERTGAASGSAPWYLQNDAFGLPAWVAPAVIGAALLLLGGRR